MSGIFAKLKKFLNQLVDIISSGNLERIRIVNQFNVIFKEAYMSGAINRLCVVSTSIGNPEFKHSMSTIYLRSGFKIQIENDVNLKVEELETIASVVVDNKPFIRQLLALGYDTFIIKGKSTPEAVQIPLKDIASLHDFMID